MIVLSIIFGLVYTYILTRPFGKNNPELLNNFYAFVKNKYKDIYPTGEIDEETRKNVKRNNFSNDMLFETYFANSNRVMSPVQMMESSQNVKVYSYLSVKKC